MAKPRKPEGYDSALGSIFDFVFKQSQQKKGKSKPYRRSGEAYGSDQFASGLAELAANPLFYASDGVLAPVNEGILNNANFIEFRLDKLNDKKYKYYDDSASRVRIRAGELGKAFSNPNKFIDGILKGAQEEHKWMRVAGAAAYIDSAIAAYAGARNGLSVSEASKLGKAALMEYTSGMKETDKRFVAGNAAMKAEVEKVMSQFGSDASWDGRRDSQAYANAIQSALQSKAEVVAKKEEALYKAMNHSVNASGGHYTGKWAPPKYLSDDIDAAKKSGDPAKVAAAEKKLKDYTDQFESRMESRFNEIESDLAKRLGNPSEARELVNELRNEVKYQKGDGMTAYRMNMHNNAKLKIYFTADEAEQRRLSGVASTALMFERIKGTDETTAGGIGGTLNDIGKSIEKLKEKPTLTATEKAYLKQLTDHQSKLKSVQAQMGGPHKVASWIEGNSPYERPVDNKVAREALKEQFNYEKTQLERVRDQAESSGDLFKAQYFQMQIDGLDKTMAGLQNMGLTTFRHNAAALTMQYRALVGGSFGAGLFNGTAYFSDASGISAPGQLAFAPTQIIAKDAKGNILKDDKGKPIFTFRNEAIGNPKIVMPRTDINPYIANMSKLYYLTPGSMMKTLLYNGEGFHFMAKMNERKIQSMFANDKGNFLKDYLMSKSGDKAFTDQFSSFFVKKDGGGFEVDSNAMAKNYLELMTLLQERGDIPDSLKRVLKKAQGMYDRNNKTWAWIGDRYTIFGLDRKIKGLVTKLKSSRDSVLEKIGLKDWRKRLLMQLSKSEGWKAAVGQFFDGAIGVKQLVRAGLVSLATALGLATTGGLATPIFDALAYFGTEVLYKLIKPALGVMFLFVWAACGILGFLFFMIVNFFTPTTVAHNAIVPGEVISGIELVPLPSDPPGNPDGNPSDGTPPTDAICPINIGASCSQGPNGRWSHAKMKTFAIDIPNPGVWKAPSDGTVTAVKPDKCPRSLGGAGQSVGNVVEFKDSKTGTIYRLIHADAMVTKGQRVTQGTPIATAATSLPVSPCWTGPHLHLDTRNGSGWVDSEKWYNGLQCNLGRCG